MTALPELAETALYEPDTRMVQQPVRKNDRGHAALASSLYEYLELDDLLQEFSARLCRIAKADVVNYTHAELGYRTTSNRGSTAIKAGFKLTHNLECDGEVLGTLVISRRCQFLSSEVRRIQRSVEELIGPLRNAVRYREVWQSAYQDALTGVRNRAALDLALSGEDAEAALVSTLIVCDVDRFKSINDAYGHPVGDEVLRQFAKMLTTRTGSAGAVYRYGGDEFVIALGNAFEDEGLLFAESVRAATAELNLQVSGHDIRITTTIGLTQVRSGESLDEAFLRADSALLSGKRKAKNMVVSQ